MKFTVEVSREGKWWIGSVPAVVGAATETTRLADLEAEVRDLLGGLLDVDDSALDLEWDYSNVIGDEGQGAWEAFLADREALNAAQVAFERDRLRTLRSLASAGVSVRDVGALVGLSHQRVAQLLSTG